MIVLVPEVAANVIAVALPAGIVIVEERVKLPLIVLGNAGPVPENPVKSRLMQFVTFVNVIVLVPAEIQMLGNPLSEPAEIVLFVEELSVVLMVAVVEVRVRFVVVLVSQTVPVPDSVQVPLPIVIVLVLELLDENAITWKLTLLTDKVPRVKVKAVLELLIKLSAIVTVPPGALTTIG